MLMLCEHVFKRRHATLLVIAWRSEVHITLRSCFADVASAAVVVWHYSNELVSELLQPCERRSYDTQIEKGAPRS
jgi:hypothetical protein